MDFKPVCLRITFCNVKLLVSVSPFKTILDLKKEISRVYHKHYPQKTEECKQVQDSSGYLACDDYQIGLVFSNGDSVFALAAGQPLDKYSELWKNNDSSSKLIADELVNKPHHIKPHHIEPISNKSTVTSTPALVRKHLDESDEASETDCSNELIPQVLEGSQRAHIPKPVVDIQKVDSANLKVKDLPQNKKEMSKNESTVAFTDSSLSDTDSELVSPNKGGGKAEPKLTPKKNSRTLQKHKKQEQNIVTFTGAGDKIKDSNDTRKSLGQKFQLAMDDANGSTPVVTKKLRAKRKHPSDEAQGTSSEKKAKKKISKKELELANTSSQSMILDNAKLWTE